MLPVSVRPFTIYITLFMTMPYESCMKQISNSESIQTEVADNARAHTHANTHAHTYAHTYTYTYTHKHTHAHTLSRTNTHTYTY